MRDAIIGICAGVLLLSAMAFSCSEKSPTIQNLFEEYEKHKAEQQMQEQIEQAKRTIQQQAEEAKRKQGPSKGELDRVRSLRLIIQPAYRISDISIRRTSLQTKAKLESTSRM